MSKFKIIGKLLNNMMIGLAISGLITFLMIFFAAQGAFFSHEEVGNLHHSYQTFFNYTWPWYLYGAWCGIAATLIQNRVFKYYIHFPLIFIPWLAITFIQGSKTWQYGIPLFIIIYMIITMVYLYSEKKAVAVNNALHKFQEQSTIEHSYKKHRN